MNKTFDKRKLLIVFMFFILLLSMISGLFSSSSNTNDDPSNNVIVKTNNTVTDIDKFSNYQKQLVSIEKPLDEAKDEYNKQSKIAIQNGDLYTLYDSAKNLHDASFQALYSLSQINVPDLDNQEAQKTFNAVQDNFNTYIGALREMSSTVMDIANTGNPTPESLNNIQEYASMYQNASINLAINIIKTYNALGVDIDKIDIKNGGLLPSNEKVS